MDKKFILITVLIVLTTALMESPEEWLAKGFDVTDGILK